MKYYSIEIVSTADQTAKGIVEHDTVKSALMAFHQAIASAMANPAVIKGLFFIMNEKGAMVSMEQYDGILDEGMYGGEMPA